MTIDHGTRITSGDGFTTATREIQFDAAHRVPNHSSKCRNLHGHRYKVQMSVGCVDLGKEGTSEEGMVLDFGFMKKLLMEEIHNVADHATLLYAKDPVVPLLLEPDPVLTKMAPAGRLFSAPDVSYLIARVMEHPEQSPLNVNSFVGNLVLLPIVPTAENLARFWGERLLKQTASESMGRAFLTALEIWETPNCSSIWFAPSDQM